MSVSLKTAGALLVILALLQPCASNGVRGAELPRVSVIVSHNASPYLEVAEGIRSYFRDQRIPVELDVYHVDGQTGLTRDDSGAALEPGSNVQVTLGSLAYRVAQSDFDDTPTVAGMIMRGEKIESSRNATAVMLEFPIATQLQWIRDVMPRQRRIGVLYDPAHNQKLVDAATELASSMDTEIVAVAIESPRDLPAALRALARRVDVLWGVSDPTALTPQTARQILLFSFRNRIPLVGLSEAWVEAGALFALQSDYPDLGVQCGELAHQILRGASPRSVPASTPRTVLYSLNLKTARHMKLELSESIIRGANRVYR